MFAYCENDPVNRSDTLGFAYRESVTVTGREARQAIAGFAVDTVIFAAATVGSYLMIKFCIATVEATGGISGLAALGFATEATFFKIAFASNLAATFSAISYYKKNGGFSYTAFSVLDSDSWLLSRFDYFSMPIVTSNTKPSNSPHAKNGLYLNNNKNTSVGGKASMAAFPNVPQKYLT